MVRTVLAAAILTGAPALAWAQEQSAPLFITATVVSTCRVEVPRSAEASTFAIMPVTVTCARGTTPRVQRPIAPAPHLDVRDALLIIDF
jgi:hypothetical protein